MNKIYPLFLFFSNLFLVSNSHANKTIVTTYPVFNNKSQDTIDINDGPYLFINQDTIIETNIVHGKVKSKILNSEHFNTSFEAKSSVYNNVSKIAALSDIHGQFDLTVSILKNNGIIDTNLNWSYGDGHLVVVGDIFDRGPMVTELLWLVYKLEEQADKKGGAVHFVLGNHECMVLQNDLRYINKKYRRVEQLLKIPYSELYNENTLLGRWLRSKPTVLKINDNLFVHGGISKEFVESGFDLEETNKMMRQSLLVKDWINSSDTTFDKYHDNFGPIWYRGYFDPEFKKRDLNKILRKSKAKHIIVGHTLHDNIKSLFDNKLFAIDSSIQFGGYGEVLLIENGNYYRGTQGGQKIEIK